MKDEMYAVMCDGVWCADATGIGCLLIFYKQKEAQHEADIFNGQTPGYCFTAEKITIERVDADGKQEADDEEVG